MSHVQGRLQEYEKTIDLSISEDRIAWELVSIWIVLQVGLGSAVVLLHVQKATWGSLGYSVLFLLGALSSLAWVFMQYRSLMSRNNWFLYGLKLERELNQLGITLNVFEFERRVRHERIALELFKKHVIRDRDQRWYEIPALRIAHRAMFILFILWAVLLLLCYCS